MVLNAVSKEYGNGEDLDVLLKTKGWRIKTKPEFIAKFGKAWASTVKASWNEDMNFLFGIPLTSEEAYGIQNQPSGKFFQKQGPTGTSWSVSMDMITDKPLPEGEAVAITETNYIGMIIVNPIGKKFKIADLQLVEGAVKIIGTPLRIGEPLKAKISKKGWEIITSGNPYNGFYIQDIAKPTGELEPSSRKVAKKESATGQSLNVKTIPDKLSYAIKFETNKGGSRKSPTQSAGELYRNYGGGSYKDKIFETFFMGNDGAWWNLVEGGSTWRWKRANPQPTSTKDYSTMTQVELKNAYKEAVEAKKYFDKDDPEFEELEETITEIKKYLK
jgi:hypothetical protein